MGLRLLADCVAARGGSLQIESEPCAGTRLSLRVPTIRPGDPSGGGPTAAALVSVGSAHTERSHHGL
jgi:hypothetical protein